MEHETGGGAVVAGVQPLRQGSDVDALVVKLLDRLEPLCEIPRQAINPRKHNRVTGLEHPAKLLPRGPAHAPARGHVGEDPVVPQTVVGEDAALGGQPAVSLCLGDPDVAEDRGIDGSTSTCDKKTGSYYQG